MRIEFNPESELAKQARLLVKDVMAARAATADAQTPEYLQLAGQLDRLMEETFTGYDSENPLMRPLAERVHALFMGFTDYANALIWLVSVQQAELEGEPASTPAELAEVLARYAPQVPGVIEERFLAG